MSDPEPTPAPAPAPPADGTSETERCGQLILERHRKPDGRLLILYHADDEDTAEAR